MSEKSKELRTALLGFDPDNVHHNYPEGMTLREGVENIIAGIEMAQSFVGIQLQQPGLSDEATVKGTTMLCVYEATIFDLRSLLDHIDATAILNGEPS
ncbi:hypothetical protein SEA_SHAGRAT_52 [Rhodococcus phage Shagrat]|nr:hypothetical protein SEA_SHAGRAT_52 [Rhodococcus phage Shagrat]